MATCTDRELLDEVFEEVALALDGLVTAFDAEDEFVERLVRALDVIRAKALQRVRGVTPPTVRPPRETHPAIERFLAQIGRA